PFAVRRGLHRDVGAALAAAGAPVDQVAGHIALGAEPGDAEAVVWLRRAASASATRSPATAGRLVERAHALGGGGDPLRETVAAELVLPLLASGRLQDAETVARDVLALTASRETAVHVHRDLAGVLSVAARYAEAIRHIEQAATLASDEGQSLLAAKSVLL